VGGAHFSALRLLYARGPFRFSGAFGLAAQYQLTRGCTWSFRRRLGVYQPYHELKSIQEAKRDNKGSNERPSSEQASETECSFVFHSWDTRHFSGLCFSPAGYCLAVFLRCRASACLDIACSFSCSEVWVT